MSFRTWRNADDWVRVADVLNAQSRADGLDYLMEPDELATERRPNLDPASDILFAEVGGAPVGVVLCSWAVRDDLLTLTSDGAVAPDQRRRGIGTELLRRAQARLADRTCDVEPGLRRVFSSWVGDQQTGARALLERDGYRAVRFTFEMARRNLSALSADELALGPPPGIEIHPARADALERILAAEDEAFRDHPGHRAWTADDTRSLLENPAYDPSLWQVAWDGSQVAGVVETTIYAHENAQLGLSRGWLDRVSVRRPWRRRGLARALIAGAFRALQARGIEEAWLGVDAENPTGALRLYESLGFERVRSGRLYVRDAPR